MTLRPRGDETGTRQLLLVLCGGLTFAVPADVVRGMAGEDGRPAAEALAGLGVAGPVEEFGDMFGVRPDPASSEPRVIVCGTADHARAFRVDRVLGVEDLPETDFRRLPVQFTGQERQWFGGLFLHGDGLALLVNPGWLIGCEIAPRPAAVRIITPRPEPAPPTPVIGRQVVTVADEMFGVFELEEAHDAESLPWAPL